MSSIYMYVIPLGTLWISRESDEPVDICQFTETT